MAATGARVVCVLGMHRSGTSLAARLVNLLGVDLGPSAALMAPDPESNPAGYWEHADIAGLNGELLSRLGGIWHTPPAFEAGWEHRPDITDLTGHARAILARDFSGAALWGFKDPRACLTLPFWQPLLPSMHYVFCVRNPIDVALSLARRDGFPLARGIDLWITYVAAALGHIGDRPAVVVRYEELMEDWRSPVGRIARWLGLEGRFEEGATRERLSAATVPALRHHRTGLEDVLAHEAMTLPAVALYTLLSRSAGGGGGVDGTLPAAHLVERCRQMRDVLSDAARERARLVQRVVAAEERERQRAAHMEAVTGSLAYRVMEVGWRLHRRLAPPGTRRGRWVDSVLRRLKSR